MHDGNDEAFAWQDPADIAATKRAAVAAIVNGDARGLCDVVSRGVLAPTLALSLAKQAYNHDKRRGIVGERCSRGGMLSACFFGVSRAQYGEGGEGGEGSEGAAPARRASVHDNAITLLCTLTAQLDDPVLLDVLMEWEPSFRMAGPSEKGDIDSTAAFFLDYDAPKCAARLLKRKSELILAPKHAFMREHAEKKILNAAKRILQKGWATHETAVLALQDIVEEEGTVQILASGDLGIVCSIGLSLLGKPELFAMCDADDVHSKRLRVYRAVGLVLRGDAAAGTPAAMPTGSPLQGIILATKHLRKATTPPFLLVA
jgi:hypothetical protein